MNQELAQLLQERNELERGNQSLVSEFSIMNRKYVRAIFFFSFARDCSSEESF